MPDNRLCHEWVGNRCRHCGVVYGDDVTPLGPFRHRCEVCGGTYMAKRPRGICVECRQAAPAKATGAIVPEQSKLRDELPKCVCGAPLTLGVVHRTEGPCYLPDAIAPTEGALTDDWLESARFDASEAIDDKDGELTGCLDWCREFAKIVLRHSAALAPTEAKCPHDDPQAWEQGLPPRTPLQREFEAVYGNDITSRDEFALSRAHGTGGYTFKHTAERFELFAKVALATTDAPITDGIAPTVGGVNRRLLRILMMRHAKSYREWDDGSLSRVDFGQYGFDRFTNALIKETAPSPKPAVDAQNDASDGELIADLIEQNRALRARLDSAQKPAVDAPKSMRCPRGGGSCSVDACLEEGACTIHRVTDTAPVVDALTADDVIAALPKECANVYGDYEKGYNKALGHVAEKIRALLKT